MKGCLAFVLPRACLVVLGALSAVWAPRTAVVGIFADRPSLVQALGQTVAGSVRSEEFVWAPSSGPLADYLLGRVVIFSGAKERNMARDVFATCARVLPDGRVLSLGSPNNLSQSASTDEGHLVARGTHAAFVVTGKEVLAVGLVSFPSSLVACGFAPLSLKTLEQRRYSFHSHVDEVTATLLPQELHLTAGDGAALKLALAPLPAEPDVEVELPGIREKAALKALGVPELLSAPSTKARVWRRTEQAGAVTVQLTRIDAPSFRWRVIPGALEPFQGERAGITGSELAHVALVITLGRTSVGTRYGLGASGTTLLPFRMGYPTLKITDKTLFGLLPAGIRPELGANEELVQLPLVLSFGEPTATARSPGTPRERGALCAQPGGFLLLAHAQQDSSLALAQVLANVGCSAAFELDRGSQDHARVFLRGSGTPPAFPYEVSVLVGSD